MNKDITISEKLEKELINVTKKESMVDAIKELVRRELIRKKNKYLFMMRNFEKKYSLTFEEFEKKYKTKMNSEVEKDYFDWDMAKTASEDTEEELKEI